MFAVYAAEPSPEDPLKSLTVGERPDPEVPDGWVAVSVEAASLNMHDIWTLRGVGIKPDQFPMILGCDGAGKLADGTDVVLRTRREPCRDGMSGEAFETRAELTVGDKVYSGCGAYLGN